MTNDNEQPSAASADSAATISKLRSRLRLQDAVIRSGATLAPTSEEREVIEWAVRAMRPECRAVLQGLLERTGGDP